MHYNKYRETNAYEYFVSRTLLYLTMKKKYPRMSVVITPDAMTMDDTFTVTEIKYMMNLMMGDYHSKHSRLYAKLERMLERQ